MTRFFVVFALALLVAFTGSAARANSPLWVVEHGDTTLYMVGTVHMMRDEGDWPREDYERLVKQSDAVWLEIAGVSEPTPEMLGLILRYGVSPDRPLSEVLTEKELEAMGSLLAGYGVPLESMIELRPWFAYLQIAGLVLVDQGFDPAQGIDIQIEQMANSRNIPVHGLETFESQFEVFADMDEEVQVAILREMIFNSEQAAAELFAALDSWTSGDLSALESIVMEMQEQSPEFYDALLAERNQSMVDGIENILEGEGTVMLAVGLAHFVGPDSIRAILEDRGYAVEAR